MMDGFGVAWRCFLMWFLIVGAGVVYSTREQRKAAGEDVPFWCILIELALQIGPAVWFGSWLR